ncbi:MAG: N-acetylmuramoyl-L-alanine amidase [Verrucomicrobiae bacterium]|nr:N-acetylmuramoyl-L-alanine amidase [Verrucomicrobiae bacterium]
MAAALALAVLSAPAVAEDARRVTQIGGVEYVGFDAVCQRHALGGLEKLSGRTTSGHPQEVPVFSPVGFSGGAVALERDDYFRLAGPAGRLVFRVDSRQFFFNDARHWLSFPLRKAEEGGLVISRIDAEALLDVLLRGRGAVAGRKFEGVVIDAGHGGSNRGAVGRNGVAEKTATLATARELKRMLEAAGVSVAMTRASDRYVDLDARGHFANRYKNHLFVSIHYNMGRSTSHGVETYALTPQGAASTGADGKPSRRDQVRYPGNEFGAESLLLADMVQRELCEHHSPEGDRGVKWARFEVLRDTRMPAILVEAGFLSHPVDAALIATEGYRTKVAAAVARGVSKFMGMMGAEPGAPAGAQLAATPPVPGGTMIPNPQPHEIPSAESMTRTPTHATGKTLNR